MIKMIVFQVFLCSSSPPEGEDKGSDYCRKTIFFIYYAVCTVYARTRTSENKMVSGFIINLSELAVLKIQKSSLNLYYFNIKHFLIS